MRMLPWLPAHADLSAGIRHARTISDPCDRLRAAVALATHARDAVATQRIDRIALQALEEIREQGLKDVTLLPVRLAILGSHSLDHLLPAIRVAGLTHGLAVSVHLDGYGGFRRTLFEGDAALSKFDPQLALIALDPKTLLPDLPLSASVAEAEATVNAAAAEVRELWRRARREFGAQAVHQTLIPQSIALIGSNEQLLPGAPLSLCRALDQQLRRAAAEDGVPIVDITHQLPEECDGCPRFDVVRWHQAKQLINPVFGPLYGDLVARVLGAVLGRSRKCLVVDLDNTLWGGVVGDDGLDGIKLGQGSPEGEAYLAFQHEVARLAERGIVIAVCSKNDHQIAAEVFERHPDMHIRMEDVACFVANWRDKAANLREIAARLNLGLDSLVFVDDNPAERAIIRRELPEVAVVELPDDVAHYPQRLAQAGYFEAISITPDDLGRSRSYAANAARTVVLDSATDIDGFLGSLDMMLSIHPISALERARAAQLINKSNQFNLTTRRRTEQELDHFLAQPDSLGLCFRLRDRFGDNGLISVILAHRDPEFGGDALRIDTWLMSCRVLGRGVEAAALEALAEAGRLMGATKLVGEYRPSGRNALVENHYPSLGFTPVEPRPGPDHDCRFWHLSVANGVAPVHHIKLEMRA